MIPKVRGPTPSTTGLLAHRSSGSGRRQLIWFDRHGQQLGALGSSDDRAVNQELAPDGQHLAVGRSVQGNTDIWLIDTSTGVESRFTFDPGIDGSAIWAPDGSRLIFGSNRNGPFDLFEKPMSGARDEQQLFASSSNKAPVDWSSNGTLLFESQEPKGSNGQWELWALSLNGAREPFPFLQTRFDEDEGQFSPDGRWVAYRSNASGQREIFVRSFPGPGGQRQISVGGGSHPRWRRDGKELFYITRDSTLTAAPIGFASAGQMLNVGAPVPLFSVHLGNTSQPRPQYVVDRDGQRFLMSVIVDEASPPITLVQNWTVGLKK